MAVIHRSASQFELENAKVDKKGIMGKKEELDKEKRKFSHSHFSLKIFFIFKFLCAFLNLQ